MKRIALILLLIPTLVYPQSVINTAPSNVELGQVVRSIATPSTFLSTVTSGANASVTLTIPAVAGQFHYITSIRITTVCTTAIAGTATLSVTTTNINAVSGGPTASWLFGNLCNVGQTHLQIDLPLADAPLKSAVVNTATTIVCPAIGATGVCSITATSYSGS